MFKDDLASVAETKHKLVKQIHNFENFCYMSGTRLNVDKSKVMVLKMEGILKDAKLGTSRENWSSEHLQILRNILYPDF